MNFPVEIIQIIASFLSKPRHIFNFRIVKKFDHYELLKKKYTGYRKAVLGVIMEDWDLITEGIYSTVMDIVIKCAQAFKKEKMEALILSFYDDNYKFFTRDEYIINPIIQYLQNNHIEFSYEQNSFTLHYISQTCINRFQDFVFNNLRRYIQKIGDHNVTYEIL